MTDVDVELLKSRDIADMPLDALLDLAFNHADELDDQQKTAVDDRLSGFVWRIAIALDKLHDIDPDKCRGTPPRLGTPNKRSYQYKLRKAVGYSYP